MKILLIGYGRMGRLIEKEALSLGHQIVSILDINDEWPEFSEKPDVAIEFTEPGSVFANIEKCLHAGIPVLIGTTGWYDKLEEVRNLCRSLDGSLLYASNFSVGVNIWFDLIRYASKLFAKMSAYTPSLYEKHHEHKKDIPSGTAITAAGIFLKEQDSLHDWSLQKDKSKLFVEALREGDVKGFHELRFVSAFDRIRISHEAFSRDGFVQGAIKGAEWLLKNKGFHDFRDVYHKVFNLNNISE